MEQPPIGDYALIGDTRTAALCSKEGSIDWMCVPRFDSAPVFGRLVGGEEAGSFTVAARALRKTSRRYVGDSAVLETTWRTDRAEVTLTEAMVPTVSRALLPEMILVRQVSCRGGPADVAVTYDPRREFGKPPERIARRSGALICEWGALALVLQVSPQAELVPGRETSIRMEDGSTVLFLLSLADRSPAVVLDPTEVPALIEETARWWGRWGERLTRETPSREAVIRSLVTLRLLTYAPSGAPVAAPTTSLPEAIGGSRNWDYRFAWPRDASIGVDTFLGCGRAEEARAFLSWLIHATRLLRPQLQPAYRLDGGTVWREREVTAAPGYRGSRPVRVGNSAGRQHQLDVYGWLLDSAWRLGSSGHRLSSDTWRAMRKCADYAAEHRGDPDAGIWEFRDRQARHVHSALMLWLTLHRAVELSRSYRATRRQRRRWTLARDALAEEIRSRGFDERRGAYVQAYGSDVLDAALLWLPAVGFQDLDSRVSGTVDAIRRELDAGGGLLYRYPPGTDGMDGTEGAFVACSFWAVRALALLGREEEAGELLESLCGRANDVGLFGEQIDPGRGEQLGNFPQALSHSALVQAAMAVAGPARPD